MKEHFLKIAKLHSDLACEFNFLAAKCKDQEIVEEIVSKVRSEFININVRPSADLVVPVVSSASGATSGSSVNESISCSPEEPVEKEKPAAKKREPKVKSKLEQKNEDKNQISLDLPDAQIQENQNLLKEAITNTERKAPDVRYTKLDLINAITKFTEPYKKSSKEERAVVFNVLSKLLKKHNTVNVNDVKLENIQGIMDELPDAAAQVRSLIAKLEVAEV
jgi:hypothetical protein